MLNYINEFGVAPGPYSLEGRIVVVSNIITHAVRLNNKGKVTKRKYAQPLVVFRELDTKMHEAYSIPLPVFTAISSSHKGSSSASIENQFNSPIK